MGCTSSTTAADTKYKAPSPAVQADPNNSGAAPPQATNGNVSNSGGGHYPATRKYSRQTEEQDQKIFVGRYDYTSRTHEDLSFNKGENLLIIGDAEGDWWMAKSMKTGREGYVPMNYIAQIATYEAEE